jgi:hypothetical protein
MGIRDEPIAPASPWQNGFAERLIGSIRREYVGHVIVFGEAQNALVIGQGRARLTTGSAHRINNSQPILGGPHHHDVRV